MVLLKCVRKVDVSVYSRTEDRRGPQTAARTFYRYLKMTTRALENVEMKGWNGRLTRMDMDSGLHIGSQCQASHLDADDEP